MALHPLHFQPRWVRLRSRRERAGTQPLQWFLRTEAASGVGLLLAAAVAIVWASSPWSASYKSLWSTELTIGTADLHLTDDLRHWVNELAMAPFFFVVGLEIKREIVHGDLRRARTAVLPVVCSIGGMVAPALIFLSFNPTGEAARGWGIPIATDIAFSIGVLALLGRRVPASLRVFLLTMAIVDDVGAIIIIAFFYSSGVHLGWLMLASAVIAAFVVFHRLGVRAVLPYVVLAGALWIATSSSGVHATLAGVVLGLLTPARPMQSPQTVRRTVVGWLRSNHPDDGVVEERDETTMLAVAALATTAVSPVERFERALHPYTSFVILPLFALANAGVDLTPASGGPSLGGPVSFGIVFGLIVGKPLGILAAALLVTNGRRVGLPAHAGWIEMAGVGLLAGIGFTVSLFITTLAFEGALAQETTVAILVGSTTAGVLGALLLLARPTSDPLTRAGGRASTVRTSTPARTNPTTERSDSDRVESAHPAQDQHEH